MNKILSVIFSAVLLAIPLSVLGLGTDNAFAPTPGWRAPDAGILSDMDAHIAKNLPLKPRLDELNLTIRTFGGQREYNQIFISGDELIPNVDPPMDYMVRENTAAILRFAETAGIPTYCMIIPTVSAIRQESLPQFSQTQVLNQKQFIENVYSGMIGRVTVIDVYPILFNARSQYLYYRTEKNLTALGGFYIYTALGPKLLEGASRPALSDYDIEYAKNDYYGELYERSPFTDTRADTLSIFRYTRNPREYTVRIRQGGSLKTYHTLYPLHLLELGSPMDIYMGGLNAVTNVASNSPYPASLLIFGDKTALSYMPFLVNYYRTVTLVDLFQLDAAGSRSISIQDYDQVLFAYSIESYLHTNHPSRAANLLASPHMAAG